MAKTAKEIARSEFEKSISFLLVKEEMKKTILMMYDNSLNTKSKLTKRIVKKGLFKVTIDCNCEKCKKYPNMKESFMLDEFRKGEYAIEMQELHGRVNRMYVGLPEIIELNKTLNEIINVKVN